MKKIFSVLCVTWFVASSAYMIPSEENNLEPVIDADIKAVAEEAILVGRILCDAASELEHDDTLSSEIDEYFFKKLWKNTKKALKKVGEKALDVVKDVGSAVVNIGKAAAGSAAEIAKKKLQEKATKAANDVVNKVLGKYALDDSVNGADVMKYLCFEMNIVGRRLIEQGERIFNL